MCWDSHGLPPGTGGPTSSKTHPTTSPLTLRDRRLRGVRLHGVHSTARTACAGGQQGTLAIWDETRRHTSVLARCTLAPAMAPATAPATALANCCSYVPWPLWWRHRMWQSLVPPPQEGCSQCCAVTAPSHALHRVPEPVESVSFHRDPICAFHISVAFAVHGPAREFQVDAQPGVGTVWSEGWVAGGVSGGKWVTETVRTEGILMGAA